MILPENRWLKQNGRAPGVLVGEDGIPGISCRWVIRLPRSP